MNWPARTLKHSNTQKWVKRLCNKGCSGKNKNTRLHTQKLCTLKGERKMKSNYLTTMTVQIPREGTVIRNEKTVEYQMDRTYAPEDKSTRVKRKVMCC